MMANNRLTSGGHGVDPNELHKTTVYATTAGTRQSFAFEKQVEVLKLMGEDKSAFTLGAGYELPVMHGQLDLDFIVGLKESDTWNPLSFMREYQSEWSGSSDSSLVSYEDLNDCRVLTRAEHKNMDKDALYILSYDVARAQGRANANSALTIIKAIPRGDGTFQKHVVNIYSFEGTHFQEQAKFLKKKVNDFKAHMLIVDSNGLGIGLVDDLVLEIDENPPYSVINDDRYNQFKTPNSLPILFLLNSSNKETKASDIHNLFMNSIANQSVKLLVSGSQAKTKVTSKDSEKISEEILPFVMTDILVEEVMNLEHQTAGKETKVNQISKSIQKDKFSSLEYGLMYIHIMERNNMMRKREFVNPAQMFMVKKPSPY